MLRIVFNEKLSIYSGRTRLLQNALLIVFHTLMIDHFRIEQYSCILNDAHCRQRERKQLAVQPGRTKKEKEKKNRSEDISTAQPSKTSTKRLVSPATFSEKIIARRVGEDLSLLDEQRIFEI